MSKKSEDFQSMSEGGFTDKELDILEKTKKFFSTDRKYIDEMLKIINGESEISIRVLDWFVANYSKKNNTFYKIKINGKESFFYVNNEYKNQLNGYSKTYFDPFCRKRKIVYAYKDKNNDKKINFLSSVGQLHFFQWAIRNKILTYVQRHLQEIEEDMKETTKKTKEKKITSMSENRLQKEDVAKVSDDDGVDPTICSSDKINHLRISPHKKMNHKIESENKHKRQQLSKSVYESGIKKSTIPVKLDFE